MHAAAPRTRALLVEAMARRYYRIRSLRGFEQLELDGIPRSIVGHYEFEKHPTPDRGRLRRAR